MLIYSEERLVPTDVNMMIIRAKDNIGYFYIHRSLYDQAVIIDDIYADSPEQLRIALTGKCDTREDMEIFEEKAPKPLAILSSFLLLVDAPLKSFEDMVGALHVMSGPLNLRKMLKIPFEMRNTPSFSLSIREEYQLAWDRFFQNTMPYSDDMFFHRTTTPMNGTQTVTEKVEDALTNIGDDGVEYVDPLEALLMGCDDDIFDFDMDDEEAATEDADGSASETGTPKVTIPAPATTTTTSASVSAPAPVAQQSTPVAPVEPVQAKVEVEPSRSGIAALLDIE